MKEVGLFKKLSLPIDENIINQKTIIPYPLPELRGFLIQNDLNKEPIYLYLPEDQYQILKYSLKIKDNHLIYDKNQIDKLIKDIGYYLDIFFKAYPLSSRISISYQDFMKKIKPCYSFILKPDEEFKKKYKFNEYEKNLKKIKENILSFSKKLKRIYSLKKISTILSKGSKDQNVSKLIEKINSFSEEEPLININNSQKPYKKILKEIFCSRLNDFRGDIVDYCLNENKYFRKDSLENFICLIEFFILLFCGIKTKYYIDELSYLNMDFYADEKNIMNFAESFHYQVQFRIKDIPFIAPYGKKKENPNLTFEEKKLIIKQKFETLFLLNKEKISSYNQERMEYYPTHCDFSRTISPGFRRFDKNDDYHICEKCKYIPNSEVCKKLECSSCFRQIDKERLIFIHLSHIMNFNKIKKLCGIKFENEEKIFMDKIMISNYEGMNERINNKELIFNYLLPLYTEKISQLDKTFRDIFGEKVGFYFVWISHFIKWLFYLALIGILMSILKLFIGYYKTFFLIMNLIFIASIVLWGNYYYKSWDGQELFYNYIWGMNDYKLIRNSVQYFDEHLKLNVEIIMGVKIPMEKPFVDSLINYLLFFMSIFLYILVIICNILIIATSSHKFNIKYKKLENFLNICWKYIVPILCFFLREIFSFVGEKWDKWIISHGKKLSKEMRRQIRIKMKMVFEFVNYYFCLYYIAFIKNYFGTCVDNDCHTELGNQLIIIIVCDLLYMILRILIPVFIDFKHRKDIKKKIKDIDYEENYSNKYYYYTRNKYVYNDMKNNYIKAILYFGYIIQFGASAPMSFSIILIATIINRIILGIALKNIFFAQIFDESIGIDKFKKWIRIISFIGILSNLCCIFYTNNYFHWMSNKRKLICIALTENILLVIIKLFDYDSLPKWFYFRDKIDFTYLRKYGIRAKKLN